MEQRAEYVAKKRSEYYNLTKNHLINYRFYKATIERRKDRLEEITAQMEGIKGTDYSRDKVRNNQVESIMERLIGEKIKIEDEIKRLDRVVKDIDRGFAELDNIEKCIVELKWMHQDSRKMSWWRLAVVLEDKGYGNYSPETVKRWGRNALHKLAGVVYAD